MNKLFLSAVSVFAVAGVAMAADSTQFGVLKVPSTAAQTIVSVPWLESTTTDKAVAVSNLVLTAGLSVDDTLKWYDSASGKYQTWILKKSGDVKYWDAVVNVDSGSAGKSEDANNQGLARGQAIILTRSVHTDGFYIMGKPAASEAGSIALPSGSGGAAVWTLIAPYKTSTIKFKSLSWQGLTSPHEHLIIDINGTRKELTWAKPKNAQNGAWYDNEKQTVTDDFDIPAGQGLWFYSTSASTSTRTVSWD